jgi:hypothetical protein
MSVGEFQKAVTYIKQIQDTALFATMIDSRLYRAFCASPLFYVMLPFIGILITINALINAYRLATAHNKNLDQWFGVLISFTCAVLASTSLFGTAASVLLGFSFAVGPWFFLSSLIVAMVHQITMLGINLRRVYESIPGSAQRMHYLQAIVNNLFILGLLTVSLGVITFVMLFPAVAPVIGGVSAIAAVVFTGVDILWRMVPHNWKISIKAFLGFGKPKFVEDKDNTILLSDLSVKLEAEQETNPNHYRLFTRFDYSAEVKRMDVASAKIYLNQIITNKSKSYESETPITDKKTLDKIDVLNELKQAVNDLQKVSKDNSLKNNPLAFQSFWAEKGEIEQLFDAVLVFQEKRESFDKNPLQLMSI